VLSYSVDGYVVRVRGLPAVTPGADGHGQNESRVLSCARRHIKAPLPHRVLRGLVDIGADAFQDARRDDAAGEIDAGLDDRDAAREGTGKMIRPRFDTCAKEGRTFGAADAAVSSESRRLTRITGVGGLRLRTDGGKGGHQYE
jgi:hypothetical protein